MSRSNLQIKVGIYAGNGVDDTNIEGVGFNPDFILIRCVGESQHSVFKTKHIQGDLTAHTANAAVFFANGIQTILGDGFQVGNDNTVNKANRNYVYLAIRGTDAQKYFHVGRYLGNGANDRDYAGGIGFTPDFVFTRPNTTSQGCARIAEQNGDTSFHMGNVADAADRIQAFANGGFQLGTNATANGNGNMYYYISAKKLTGVINTGTYTGTGAAKSITGVGFQPDIVIVKNGSTTSNATLAVSTMTAGESFSVASGSALTTGITSLDADGFTVSTDTSVNGDGNTHWWVALKAGNFNAPLVRTAL